MAELISNIYFLILWISFAFSVQLIYLFYRENERPAVRKMTLISALLFAYILIAMLVFPGVLIIIDLSALILILIYLTWPFSVKKDLTDNIPALRYDERDIMFSRKELSPGSMQYDQYYRKNPKREILDLNFRKEPGLLSKKSLYYHPAAFKIAENYFKKIDQLIPFITGLPSKNITELNIFERTQNIKQIATSLGALNVGITKCKDYHFYSHKGRGTSYGKQIYPSDKFAIAFTVEMDHQMVAAAPKASILMESSKQYYNAAKIAIGIAEQIRNWGFEAKAHIDGNYELICPLVARDAGLGELGRMGILMTPTHGPRVRIAVVTTTLELIPDNYIKNHTVLDFCRICKKCADCCPSNAISFSEPETLEGTKRWKINSEACYTYWCKAGTDCGRCMAVCPYSHPNNVAHKLTRWAIRHSSPFRKIAVILDDFFYGKKPTPKKIPQINDSDLKDSIPKL